MNTSLSCEEQDKKYLVQTFKINEDGTKQEKSFLHFFTDDLEENKHKHNIDSNYVTEISENKNFDNDIYPRKQYYTRDGRETIHVQYKNGSLMINDGIVTSFLFLKIKITEKYSCTIGKNKGKDLRFTISSKLLEEKNMYDYIYKHLFSDVEPDILQQIEGLILDTEEPLYDFMGRKIETVDTEFFKALVKR